MSEKCWHKSSYSGGSTGSCVEVAEGAATAVRDTRNREQGHLEFPAAEWTAFVVGARSDEL
ncbi:DUF397 domain-containing protein [Nocardiopsis chromatogenes]|uniref:DUF397 domain-containing protein n=1 Tax=Nocardiopsis chromatogenes TaxID=280239 RepID=UPI000476453C|nr:DUF397 domain-containing protein [Nocardiopsis chromatogenes]